MYNIRENNPNWKGGQSVVNGYLHTLDPQHHRANYNGYVRTHILIAEKVLCKKLPGCAVIHHFDGDRSKNKGNLVICQDNSYHKLLHKRMRAQSECGHPDWVKCRECKKYDKVANLSVYDKKAYIHKECNRLKMKKYREKNPNYFNELYRKHKGRTNSASSKARIS